MRRFWKLQLSKKLATIMLCRILTADKWDRFMHLFCAGRCIVDRFFNFPSFVLITCSIRFTVFLSFSNCGMSCNSSLYFCKGIVFFWSDSIFSVSSSSKKFNSLLLPSVLIFTTEVLSTFEAFLTCNLKPKTLLEYFCFISRHPKRHRGPVNDSWILPFFNHFKKTPWSYEWFLNSAFL